MAARDGNCRTATPFLGRKTLEDYTVHDTAIVDPGAQIELARAFGIGCMCAAVPDWAECFPGAECICWE